MKSVASAAISHWSNNQLIVSMFRLLLLFVLFPLCLRGEKKPNILWIFSEDLSPYMGCYGDPTNRGFTPVIDQFAAQGVLFKRAFVPAPVCSACRSAMITGVMQTTTGTHQHRSSRWTDGIVVPEEVRIHLPKAIKTIPELMREAGYFTFNSGKDDYNFHYDRTKLYTVGSRKDYQPGQNGWQGNRSQHYMSLTKDTWNARPDKSQPWFGQIEIKGGKAGNRYTRKGQLLQPEDVALPPYFPDRPAIRKAWTTHYNAARGADVRVHAILKQLEEDQELENTIIFFFSDHGNNQSIRHKQFCYEGGVHIPLMIQGNHPALKRGTVRNEIVNALDIPATTLAFGGVELPDYLDGQNLFGEDYQAANYVVSARDRCDYTIDKIRTVRTDRYRYLRNYYPERAMLQAQYRDNRPEVLEMHAAYKDGTMTPYQAKHWFGQRPQEELYDLEKDPHQVHNLANDPHYSSELKKHRQLLEDWIKRTNDKGQLPEATLQLKATYDLWKNRDIFKNAKVNPEYDQFRE